MINANQYQKNIEMLIAASTPNGFVAAVNNTANYKRVWARDGAITSIAAIMSGNQYLIDTAKSTIQTLFSHQHQNGFIPSNVSFDKNKKVSYGGIVGRVDNNAWAVIALCYYILHTNDTSLKAKYKSRVEKCFHVLDIWEFNGKHLMYQPQSGDWADEYIHHGYILFNQLLRVWALHLAFKVYEKAEYKNKYDQIINVIQTNFWKSKKLPQNVYHKNLFISHNQQVSSFWLMGFNPSRVYEYFDLQANAIALLLQIGNSSQNRSTIQFIQHLFESKSNQLLPSYYPTILRGSKDMELLKSNYAFEFRNHPHQFHNGGLWSVWNGLLVWSLNTQNKKKLATAITKKIYEANAINNCFNECIDGKTQQPCGVNFCTWSAAGAIIAEKSFEIK